MKNNFWKNKKVLITGHTGFKGGWLAFMLSLKGAKVIGYALKPSTKPNLYQSLSLDKKTTSIIGDIRDLKNLKAVLKKHKPEIVFHLAAQPLVRASYKNPIETYEVNILGTANLLEAVRVTKSVKVAVCITTDKCYRNNEWLWPYREEDALGGLDPYSSSKAGAELVISSYRDSFFKKDKKVFIASTRAGNVIGGGDWSEDRIVPDIMRSLFGKSNLEIRNPNSVRPWQHVIEPLVGYIQLAEMLWRKGDMFAEAWNFGPDTNKLFTVKEIINILNKYSTKKISVKLNKSKNPHEANLLMLDSSKARFKLGWTAKLSVEEALKSTMEWYEAFYKRSDMNEFTKSQIEQYEGVTK